MKKIKLLLINAMDPQFLSSLDSPLHLASLASYLIKNNILLRKNIKIACSDYDNILSIIKKFKPNIIGISVLTPFYPYSTKLAIKIKKESNAPIIIGGPHISGYPQGLKWPFDIGVIGEGEITLAELIKKSQKSNKKLNKSILKSIKGLVFINKNKHIITTSRPLMNIKNIAPIDYSLLPKERIIHYLNIVHNNKPIIVKAISIYTARGCPYNCSFCAYQVIWGKKKRLRFFSPKTITKNVIKLKNIYNINAITVLDDTFGVTKKRLKKLIKEFQKTGLLNSIYFNTVMIRANLVDNEFAILLKKMGISSVFLGIESGSQKILNYLKNSSLKVYQIKNAVKIFQKYNIKVIGSFMLFSPYEKKSDLQKTLSLAKWFAKQKNALKLSYGITTPFPGTKLWNLALKEKIISPPNINWKKFTITNNKFFQPFFSTNLKISQQKDIWSKFRKLSISIKKRFNNNSKWKTINKLTNNKNRELYKNYIAWIMIEKKLNHLIKNPRKKIINIINNPKKIIYFIENLFFFFKKQFKN